MSDDLDDLIRRTMKTLDDQVPSGYFEALPNRTLARLEGKDMQSTTGTSNRSADVKVPPPVVSEPATPAEPAARDEDSGLHDIRSLAQSTKQRLSNKRVTTSPVQTASDDDVLAASSAGWKHVALPEPAKMVSLPSLDELPSKKEIVAKEKAAKKQAAVAAEMPAAMLSSSSLAAPVPAAQSQRFAHITSRKKSKAPLAIAGMLVAAAAGVAIYMATQQGGTKSDSAAKATSDNTVAIAQTAPAAPAPVVTAVPEPPKAAEAPPPAEIAKDEPAQGAASTEVAKAEPAPMPVKPSTKHTATKTKGGGKIAKEPEQTEATPPVEKKPADEPKKKAAGSGSNENEPSFDALLKEAGVDQNKKVAKPKLANTNLSASDFKRGMGGVSSKAQGCYKGTQGTASFKVAVAPSGQVTGVSVTGLFAGKPEASCVEAAVKSASFPPWDGPPASFTYSYLLAE